MTADLLSPPPPPLAGDQPPEFSLEESDVPQPNRALALTATTPGHEDSNYIGKQQTSSKHEHHLLSLPDLSIYFGYSLLDAAKRMGLCPTMLKRECRRLGIKRWPFRQIRKHQGKLKKLEKSRNARQAKSRASKNGYTPSKNYMFRTQVKIEQSLLALECLRQHGKYPNGYNPFEETAARNAAAALEANGFNPMDETAVRNAAAEMEVNEEFLLKQEKEEPASGDGTGDKRAPRRTLKRRKIELSSSAQQQTFKGEVKEEGTASRLCSAPLLRAAARSDKEWQDAHCPKSVHDVAEDFPDFFHLPGSDSLTPMRGEELRAMWQ